jgi:hypothetical protein
VKISTDHTKIDIKKAEYLFLESIAMAKLEVSRHPEYNMNIDRTKLLISFFMDYLRYQKKEGKKNDSENHYKRFFHYH